MQGILAGRYRLDRQLGKGGMGSVWLAEHLTLNSWVAVKLMDPSIAATTEGAERFKREAQAAASLRSAHVVQVLDYGVHENTPFLVMELLQGQSLAECLEREQRLTPERTLSIITQVARAIGRAHAAGIVHRDLKPDNIFLISEDGQELAKVLDFGIAKTTGPRFGGMETRTGVTMGTPYYMSPEQVEGKKALDHRADLWSLAVITCECLSGLRPFDGETYGELLLNICARPIATPSSLGLRLPGFDEWFAKGANRELERRFNSAQELASALGDVVAGRVQPAALSAPQASGPDATLPMNSPTLAFSGTQAAQAVSAQSSERFVTPSPITAPPITAPPMDIGIRPHPGPAVRPKQRALVPIALGALIGLLLLLGVVLVIALSKRGSPDTEATLGAGLGSASAAVSPAAAPLELSPATQETASARPSGTAAPKVVPDAPAAAAPVEPKTAPVVAMPTLPTLPALNPVRTAPAAPTATHAATSARCFADPFTGQVRVADAAHAAQSFACKQNPFTGAFQRL
ncbi:MAG TPA: serine/threonine-protein kinase [Polyangiaceae bacterium]|jgi:serine/threonine-protein kinase